MEETRENLRAKELRHKNNHIGDRLTVLNGSLLNYKKQVIHGSDPVEPVRLAAHPKPSYFTKNPWNS